MATSDFKPALLVVDFQEDFCPPNGSLAVAGGRDIAPVVNALLRLPFSLKLATKDWHPPSHVSFAANHPGAQPYVSTIVIKHPSSVSLPSPPSPPLHPKPQPHSRPRPRPPTSSPTPPPSRSDPPAAPIHSYETRLWPTHCVQHTSGAELAPELDASALDAVVEKGTDARVEMYSAFYDPLRVCDTGLAATLRREGVTHVFVVGLAADYCVRSTAEDAAREGFETVVVEEGTRAVDPVAWEDMRGKLEGVSVVSVDGEDVGRVMGLGSGTR
jgi:nicotinamidase-related amidase